MIGPAMIGPATIGTGTIGARTIRGRTLRVAGRAAVRFAILTTITVVALGILYPAPARAYVRYLAKDGRPYAWPSTCVRIVGYPQGLTSMTVDQITTALTQAVGSWSIQDPTVTNCSYLDLQLTMEPATQPPPEAKYDRYNNVVFRTAWTSLCNLDPNGTPVCHDPAALAITSVFAISTNIVDADIEINASATFHWADLVTTPPIPGSRGQDLQNALTHEMGHLIGLDHTCYIFSNGGADDPAHPRPRDQNNELIPDCVSASPEVQATTMFASADPGDVSKRTLAPDDLQAVCEIYPRSSTPMSCAPAYDAQVLCDASPRAGTTTSCPPASHNGGGGCTVAESPSAPFGVAESRIPPWMVSCAALVLAVLVGTRRARRPTLLFRGSAAPARGGRVPDDC